MKFYSDYKYHPFIFQYFVTGTNLRIANRQNNYHDPSNPVLQNGYNIKGNNSGKHFTPDRKGAFSKRKEFAPNGSKFFPFRVDSFSEWAWCAENQTEIITKVISLVKMEEL